jgi:protein-tyrosine phosphatase
MAEGLLQAELGPGIRVESAGLGAEDGRAAHPEAIRLMAERGIDLNGFRSRQLTADMALAADLILVMDTAQMKWCETMVPSACGRIQLLGRWLPPDQKEIADPFRKNREAFLQSCNLIQQSVTAWRRYLQGLKC